VGESELIAKLVEGHRVAYEELLAAYSGKVLNICYKFLLDKQDAEDLSQEVFLEIFQSISSFRGQSKLSTWIYRVSVTKCLDELRKRKRKKRLLEIGSMLHLDEVVNWLTGGATPEKKLLETEKFAEINRALSVLPDNQRVAFTLSKIEGYSNGEIAEIMNTTTIAVESLVYRAKKKISKDLETILKNNS